MSSSCCLFVFFRFFCKIIQIYWTGQHLLISSLIIPHRTSYPVSFILLTPQKYPNLNIPTKVFTSTLSFRTMTKLLEWISVLSAFFAVWYSLIGGYVKHPFIDNNMTLILVSPILFVILFGLYAVTVILYRVLTFNNCEEAAKELQAEIIEAKNDLRDRGLRWWNIEVTLVIPLDVRFFTMYLPNYKHNEHICYYKI